MRIAAVVIAFGGCLLDSASLAVWRLSAAKVYNTGKVTTVGYVLQFSSMLLDVTSLTFLAEFTHSIVDAFSLVAALVVSKWLLGESPSRIEIQSALCIMVGIVLTIVSRPVNPTPMSYADALERFGAGSVIAWFALFAGLAAFLRGFSESTERFLLLPVSAGIIGALCETLAKVMTESLDWSYGDTAAILTVIFVFIMCELYIIRISLRVLPMYAHQPTFYATWAVGGMLSGGFVYGDLGVYENDITAGWVTICGISLVLFGCILPQLSAERQMQPSLATNRVSTVLKKLVQHSVDAIEMEPLSRTV